MGLQQIWGELAGRRLFASSRVVERFARIIANRSAPVCSGVPLLHQGNLQERVTRGSVVSTLANMNDGQCRGRVCRGRGMK